MREHLVLRFDAPLMSFGSVKVDERGPTSHFPGLSMITGLLANALGIDHREFERLERLQGRIRFAVRRDRLGTTITDYQTVDLGQAHLAAGGWTTRGEPEDREGGPASVGTAIRLRQYVAGAVYVIVLRLDPPDVTPTLDDLAEALRRPERPLFLGRKTCIPSSPVLVGKVAAPSLTEALRAARDPATQEVTGTPVTAWLPADEPCAGPSVELQVADERDWRNQVVAGGRFVRQITLDIAGEVR